jgi:hypothetical protein
MGSEGEMYWSRIVELDITAEGATLQDALGSLVESAREWLQHLRDERPVLSEELAPQARYVPLLDVFPGLWFKSSKVL